MQLSYTCSDYFLPVTLQKDFLSAQKLSQIPSYINLLHYLLRKFFGMGKGTLEFIKEEHTNENFFMSFRIKTNKENIYCTIDLNDIRLSSPDAYYVFNILPGYPATDFRIKEYGVFEYGKLIIERFDSHQMELEVHFRGNGKVLVMNVPMNRDNILPTEFCRELGADDGLVELKRFYYKYFYPYQSSFDKNEMTTSLSVWNAEQLVYNDPFAKGVMLDELQMGAENHYQLSEVRDHNLVVLKDGVYSIYGYNIGQASTVDFNAIMKDLAIRERRLN